MVWETNNILTNNEIIRFDFRPLGYSWNICRQCASPVDLKKASRCLRGTDRLRTKASDCIHRTSTCSSSKSNPRSARQLQVPLPQMAIKRKLEPRSFSDPSVLARASAPNNAETCLSRAIRKVINATWIAEGRQLRAASNGCIRMLPDIRNGIVCSVDTI